MSNEWKKYTGKSLSKPEAECFYQKEIIDGVFAEIYEYAPFRGMARRWEVSSQIPEDRSIIGETINILIFTYDVLDFERMENDARAVISQLVGEGLTKEVQ